MQVLSKKYGLGNVSVSQSTEGFFIEINGKGRFHLFNSTYALGPQFWIPEEG